VREARYGRGSRSVKRFQLRIMRSIVRRACSSRRPGAVKIRKRSLFGRAFGSCGNDRRSN